jgi:carboxypeptidase Taq
MSDSSEFQNPTVKEILRAYKPIWSIQHARSLLGWDLEVYMPEKGGASRGLALAQLELMAQKMMLDLRPLLSRAEKETSMGDTDNGVIRVLKRDLHYFECVPPRLIEELRRTATEATVVWRAARKDSNFSSFEPYLEKIVGLKKEEADKLGYEKHPYNALLDRFEEGLTVDDVDAAFSMLAPALKRILDKVMTDGRFSKEPPLTSITYEKPSMERVNQKMIELLAMPKDRLRMDVSTHPFTTGIAPDDVRITTRYEGVDFKATMYSTIHESGHAIYQLQIGDGLAFTPLGRGASTGIHESQSRFWENAVGRSREFVHLVMPTLKENLSFLGPYGEDQVYAYLNSVKPSMIRVDADELTYNFHIMLRYDIEKRLLAGEVSVSDLPSIWNDTMDKYLGLRPANDAEGVLQDIHWSGGDMGYFPTYSMGNVLVGVIWKALGKELAGMVEQGQLMQLRGWLREKVHKYGATYPPKELLKRSFRSGYDPAPLLDYLEQKFLR